MTDIDALTQMLNRVTGNSLPQSGDQSSATSRLSFQRIECNQPVDTDREEIAALAEALDRARSRYEAHQIANTPSDSVEREKAAIARHVAQAEYFAADSKLRQAQERMCGESR